ncbi:UBP-type zinc finger domain-containing protein [Peterkaempfera sp. SMS 1(5)a]|uniref:UBP-type zinc finger domain-containing protein n=1 Tax=Peterkaempfera podocarpi TaxID=3232308 RepID=UPI00366B926D
MANEDAIPNINPAVPPSGDGCFECLAGDAPGWWFHLRRCAACGHIGCCDSSPAQHATQHAREAGHAYFASYEPGESWLWNIDTEQFYTGAPVLAPPAAHPASQPVPGPRGRVPDDWQQQLH